MSGTVTGEQTIRNRSWLYNWCLSNMIILLSSCFSTQFYLGAFVVRCVNIHSSVDFSKFLSHIRHWYAWYFKQYWSLLFVDRFRSIKLWPSSIFLHDTKRLSAGYFRLQTLDAYLGGKNGRKLCAMDRHHTFSLFNGLPEPWLCMMLSLGRCRVITRNLKIPSTAFHTS